MALWFLTFDELPQNFNDAGWVVEMNFLVDGLSFKDGMKFWREFLGEIDKCLDYALLDYFANGFVDVGEVELEALVVGLDDCKSIEVEEYFKELAEEFIDAELGDDLVPMGDAFVEDAHDCE